MRIWLRFSFGFCWFDSEISSGWSSFNRNCKKRNSAWTSFRFQDRNNPLRDSSSEFFFCLIRYQKRSQWRSNIFTWHCHNFLLFHHFYFFLLHIYRILLVPSEATKNGKEMKWKKFGKSPSRQALNVTWFEIFSIILSAFGNSGGATKSINFV